MFSDEIEKKKIFKKVHSIELLLWLILTFFIAFIFSTGMVLKNIKSENDYQIFLPDVDGLIVGSPVKMMGIEIGHVVKIKPIQDEVYVKFIITNPNVKMPQGTVVTVEFSGMAGSKSLELYLPENSIITDKNTPMLIVSSPKRLHDAMDLLDTMYKKLTSIIYSVSYFGSEISNLNTINNNKPKADFSELINYSDSFINNSYKREQGLAKFIERLVNDK